MCAAAKVRRIRQKGLGVDDDDDDDDALYWIGGVDEWKEGGEVAG